MKKSLNRIVAIFILLSMIIAIAPKVYAEGGTEYYLKKIPIDEPNRTYNTIDEYLEDNYEGNYYDASETELIFQYAKIEDFSFNGKYPNLEYIYFYDMELGDFDFGIFPKLKQVIISNSTLDGTLKFGNGEYLENISIELVGDLSNAVIDIRNVERCNHVELFNEECIFYFASSDYYNFDKEKTLLYNCELFGDEGEDNFYYLNAGGYGSGGYESWDEYCEYANPENLDDLG